MGLELENIGSSNPEPISGITTTMYYALRSNFTKVAEPPAFDAVGGVATKAACVGDHEFAQGKGFNTIKLVVETGKVESATLGERKRRLYQNTFTGQIAGTNEEVLGFMRMVKNEDFIVLVEEVGSGNIRQFGSARLSAEFSTMSAVIEEAVEGNNSLTITITDKQKWPAPVYGGDIVTLPII